MDINDVLSTSPNFASRPGDRDVTAGRDVSSVPLPDSRSCDPFDTVTANVHLDVPVAPPGPWQPEK
jgi:hypothetical protein